jgi:hypothetical protein
MPTKPHARSTESTRVDRPCTHHDPMRQPFSVVAQSFYYVVSHFYYNELSHFARVNSTILSYILEMFTQSFWYSELNHFLIVLNHFLIAIVPSRSLLLQY